MGGTRHRFHSSTPPCRFAADSLLMFRECVRDLAIETLFAPSQCVTRSSALNATAGAFNPPFELIALVASEIRGSFA
jgi:hypothetical protein